MNGSHFELNNTLCVCVCGCVSPVSHVLSDLLASGWGRENHPSTARERPYLISHSPQGSWHTVFSHTPSFCTAEISRPGCGVKKAILHCHGEKPHKQTLYR